ncbi:MAG: zinc ribbon domain-containing protein [Patescibacteria group bacterium]
MMCESCGVPLNGKFISKKDGRYCVYCQDQKTGGLATRVQVRAGSIGATMKFMGKTKEEAENMVDETMPTLPRWKKG